MYEIEMAVIGCLFLWYEDFSDTMEIISENDFATPACREVFNIIKNSPDVKDKTLLLAQMSNDAKFTAVRASEAYVASYSNFNNYVAKLKEYSNSRKIKEKLFPVVMANNDNEIITAEQLRDIAGECENEVVLSYAEKAKSRLNGFAERATGEVKKIETGFKGIDNVIGGLRIPAVSIIGALPSTGKTSFALNIVNKQLLDCKKTVVFSLEMSCDMIYERLACIFNEMDYNVFNTRKFSNTDINTLNSFQKMLSYMELYVFDDIYDIETQALICSQLKPEFVFVDYVQKVTSNEKKESRRAEVEYISSKYKQMANKLNCHIMLLSQLTRGSDSTPTMRNLKESGALEADGDYIMLLNRPYVYDKTVGKYNPSDTTLMVDKNKFGGTGIIDMKFDGKHQKFFEVEYKY